MKKTLYILTILLFSVFSWSMNLDYIEAVSGVNLLSENKIFSIPENDKDISDRIDNIGSQAEILDYLGNLSQSFADNEKIVESIEAVYDFTVSEIEKDSEFLCKNIVDENYQENIKKYVNKMKSEFKSNKDMGIFYTLNSKLLEKMSNMRIKRSHINIVSDIQDVILKNEKRQRIFGIDHKKYIQKFGLKITDYFREQIDVFLKDKDKEKFLKKYKYIEKAFSLYKILNRKFCIEKSRENTPEEELYESAMIEIGDGNYMTAVNLLQRLIAEYPSYAFLNGAYYETGYCYEQMGDNINAIEWYKKSILNDKTDPFKRYSYSKIITIYNIYNGSEEEIFECLKFFDWCIEYSPDENIRQNARYDKSKAYNSLYNMTEDPELKKEYYTKEAEALELYIEKYINTGEYQPEKGEVYNQLGFIYYVIASFYESDLEKREEVYNKSIERYKENLISDNNVLLESCYLGIVNGYAANNFLYGITDREKTRDYGKDCEKYTHMYMNAFSVNANEYIRRTILYAMAGTYIRTGNTYLYDDENEYEKIIENYEKAKEMFSSIIPYQYMTKEHIENILGECNFIIGTTYLYFEKDKEKAQKFLKLSEEQHLSVINNSDTDKTEKVRAYSNIVNTYRFLEDYDKALWACNQAIGITDYQTDYYIQAGIYVQMGTMYLLKGESEKAREIFTNVNTYYPNSGVNSKSDIGIADSYRDEQNYEEAEKYFTKVIEDPFYNNFEKIHHQEKIRAYQELIEIYKKTDNYSKADEMLKKVLGAYYDSGYYYNDDFVKKAKEIYIETVKVQIEPVIEEMKEGEKKRLTASLVYKDGNPVDMTGLENIQWNWSITGNEEDSYSLEPLRTNSTQADFTLYKGNFMDIIISAKVDFSVAERIGSRTVSREFTLEGDNQVPIMIVNEDDRRIKNIPMINPHNLEGIGMGESPYAGDPLHLSLKFLSEYTDNKADEIEAMILDPYYSLSHHVVLKETGDDTRIFRTEIPEVNQDDNPDNDVAYDSFEVKINYPLPYPQIITHRSLADSCEIEYVKKNGEIINDFDDDGEIQEKERLHFPVWQGPDYEDEERWVRLNSASVKEGSAQTQNYYISNMVFTKEQCKPLDQTQFIAKNAKFYVKVLVEENSNERNRKISITDKIGYEIGCFLEEVGLIHGYTHSHKILKTIKPIMYVPYTYKNDCLTINGEENIVCKVYDDTDETTPFLIEFENYKKKSNYKKIFLFLKSSLGPKESDEKFKEMKNQIINICKDKLDYTVIVDESLTGFEFYNYINYGDILYYNGHGGDFNYSDNDEFLGFTVDEYLDLSSLTYKLQNVIFTKDIEKIINKYDFVFMNCCFSGLEPGNDELSNALNTKNYLGWNIRVNSRYADDFGFFFFNKFYEENDYKGAIKYSLEESNKIKEYIDLNIEYKDKDLKFISFED